MSARLKSFWISQREVLWLLRDRYSELPDYVRIPASVNVPQGAKVHHVYYDNGCTGFRVVMEHESFEEIREGQDIPSDQLLVEWVAVRVVQDGQVMHRLPTTLAGLCKLRDDVNERIYDLEHK